MKTRHKRLALVGVGLLLLSLAAWFVLSAFKQNLVFFFTPTQVSKGQAPKDSAFRVGGLVEVGSVVRQADGVQVNFVITDTVEKISATYRGSLPDLFREGKGVVAEGRMDATGRFLADQVLAKHDENYMPPDAQYALDKAAKSSSTLAPTRPINPIGPTSPASQQDRP